MLPIVAGLLTSSLAHLMSVERGFDADRVLTMTIDLGGTRYAVPTEHGLFFDRFLAKVRAINGVQDAGAITQLPVIGQTWNDPIYLEHAPRDQWKTVDNRYTSPGYFPAMHVRVLSGRLFDDGDRSRGVAVLSQKAAQLLWPGDANPVGRTFMGEDDKIKPLVGIVADVRATLAENPPPTAYYPYWQREPFTMSLVVLFLGHVIRGLLFGTQPTDPLTIASVTGMLLAVGMLACFIPAPRVANADALRALRAGVSCPVDIRPTR